MAPDTLTPPSDTAPSAFNYILSFVLVGIAWGFTTPFIRRAAVDFNKRQDQTSTSQKGEQTIGSRITSLFWTVVNLLRTPAYAIPLVLNLTGSVWFFLLVGKHGTYHSALFSDLYWNNRLISTANRIVAYGAHHKLNGVPLHGPGRVVCRAESDCARDNARHAACSWGDRTVRAVKGPCLI